MLMKHYDGVDFMQILLGEWYGRAGMMKERVRFMVALVTFLTQTHHIPI